MTAPTLYVYCTSPYAAKVAAVLHFKSVPFETVHLDPVTKAELAFVDKLNLRKIVPTITVDGETRQNSTDICIWLDQRYPQPSILGADAHSRAAILKADRWVSDNFMPAFFRELLHHHGSYLTWLKDRWRYGEVLHACKPIPWYLRLFYPWILKHVGFIRAHARGTRWDESLPAMRHRLLGEFLQQLGDGPFLGGQARVNLADLALYPTIMTPYVVGLENPAMHILFEQDPQARAWLARVRDALMEKTGFPYLFSTDAVVRPV
ncbi:MAG: glutathione S-transferase family protein [Xanthomonadaceae bacterium]|nr:glutathione S-transferase family protein [Xanthomonadaceae bacterium]MDE2308684.1 glutathione S-transferase family protein [Xanthomonadaceae bacterium]